MLVIALPACQYNIPSMLLMSKLMSTKELFDRQSFSQDGQSMVFGSRSNNYVIYVRDIENTSNAVKIDLPFTREEDETYFYFQDLCLADEIWVTTAVGQIASYNASAGTWTIHPRMKDSQLPAFCQTLSDNRIIIFRDSQFAMYQGEWTYYELPNKEVVTGVALNSQNQVYAISFYGNLFLLENGRWQELPLGLEDVEIFVHRFGFSSDDILWVADDNNNVYAWDPSANTAPRKFVLDVGQEEYKLITGFFIGPRGQVWINTTDGLWLIDNNKVQKITYPQEDFRDAYLEPMKERLYFSYGLSISYYDLKYLTGK
jgi:hypothetical protein